MRKTTLLCLLLAGCGLSSEEQFTNGARLDACDGAVPVCTRTAGCRLGEDENYVQMKVPTVRSFIVNTEGEADITLKFFWRKQVAPGRDVDVAFFEPGCNEPHRFYVTGEEMFRSIGQDSQWEVTKTVFNGGDHLVELSMDAQGEFLMKVVITTPDERGQEPSEDVAPEPDLPQF